jgi:DNA-binding transcriptional MocR family regulator
MINFRFNYPSLKQEATMARKYFQSLSPGEFDQALSIPAMQGHIKHTAELGKLVGIDWPSVTGVSELVICNSGNHALSCIFQGLRSSHETILAESFTFSAFKFITSGLHYQVLPINMDEEGVQIERLIHLVATTGSKLLYIQPTIQNPTCSVLSLERRKQIVELAKAKKLFIIEDDAYRFLHPSPPPSFLELLPEQTIHVYSLSKPFNPLIKTAFVIVPKCLKDMMTNQVRLLSSGNSSLLTRFADSLLKENTLQVLVQEKQKQAFERQQLAKTFLTGCVYQTFATSYHLWITLPAHLQAGHLSDCLEEKGVQIANGMDSSFSEEGERYIRIALGAENDKNRLIEGLQIIQQMLTR